MAPILYTLDFGYPTRGVKLVIRNLNINVELRPVDVLNGEHLSPEFLKLNPAHTVPFLKDGDLVINESKAIAQYIIDTLAPKSCFLGKDAKEKAKINQMLWYEATNLAQKLMGVYMPVVKQGATVVSEESKKALRETFDLLNVFICKGYWAAGQSLSIADFFLLATIETIVQFGMKLDAYPNVQDWYKRCHTLPGFNENQEGAKVMAEWFKAKLTEELTW